MEIHSAHFLKGVIGSTGVPQPSRPTIAFFGRSNVGKSSLINCLTRTTIARANKKPGRTTEINYYLANENLYLADLPGYGYAKLPPKLRDKISGYLSWFAADQSIDLRLALIIVDASIEPKESDQETLSLLQEYGRPILILANKVDKGSQREITQHLQQLEKIFTPCQVLPFSAKTGRGRHELLAHIEQALQKRPS